MHTSEPPRPHASLSHNQHTHANIAAILGVNKNLNCQRPDRIFTNNLAVDSATLKLRLTVTRGVSTKMTLDVYYHNHAITCVFQISLLQM